jgi:ABC-2 type transport system ATP-binding protein
MNSGEAILSTRDLGKTFRRFPWNAGHRALDGVSLEVGRGSIFGLLGPNGAGKTTLIKILLGLVRGYEGGAAMLGAPPGTAVVRRRVGYLPEAHRMPSYLTGRQVLRLFGMLCGRDKRWLAPRVDALLDRVGMTESADRKLREYSKGMQQRIGLAQALVHEPDLVFLDEPTDGVDPVGRAAMREMVVELKERGTTVFINSHLLMEVEQICDQVVIMDRGKVVRQGAMGDLTGETGTVEFELDAPRGGLEGLLTGLGSGLRADGTSFELVVDGPGTDAVIDRLRGAGIGIRAVRPRRMSLEQSFIDLVSEEGSR